MQKARTDLKGKLISVRLGVFFHGIPQLLQIGCRHGAQSPLPSTITQKFHVRMEVYERCFFFCSLLTFGDPRPGTGSSASCAAERVQARVVVRVEAAGPAGRESIAAAGQPLKHGFDTRAPPQPTATDFYGPRVWTRLACRVF